MKPILKTVVPAAVATALLSAGAMPAQASEQDEKPSISYSSTSIVVADPSQTGTDWIEYMRGLRFYVNGQPFNGFDYKTHVYELSSDVKGVTVDKNSLPTSHWKSAVDYEKDETTGANKLVFTITNPDDTWSTGYTFIYGGTQSAATVASESYSKDDLSGMTVTVNGKPLDGFNYGTTDYQLDEPVDSLDATVPEHWTGTWDTTAENGKTKITLTVTSPDGTVKEQYTFTYTTPEDADDTYAEDDLKTLSATINGKPVDGFDYKTTEYTFTETTANITLSGIPTDWTVGKVTDAEHGVVEFTVTSPDGTVSKTYTFTYEGAASGDEDHKSSIDDLKDLTVTIGGEPFDEFDYRKSNYTLDKGPVEIKLGNIPADWKAEKTEDPDTGALTFTLTSPDGLKQTYTFTYVNPNPGTGDGDEGDEQEPHEYTVEDLKDVVVTIDGEPLDGFDYKKSDYEIAKDGGAINVTYPSDWTLDEERDDENHTITCTLTSPDGKFHQSYSFKFTGATGGQTPGGEQTPSYSIDDLKDLTINVNGQPIEGFDPENGDYTVDVESGEITINGIPEGWEQTQTTDDATHTVTITIISPDGTFDKEYQITFTPDSGQEPEPTPETYTVTFDGQGGSSVESQQVPENGKATKPEDPTRDGYKFVCWLLDGEPYDFDTVVTGDITLTAQWEQDDQTEPAPEYSADDLKNLTVSIGGQAYDEFTPDITDYTIEGGKQSITFNGVPADWKHSQSEDGDTVSFTFTSPDGEYEQTYSFTFKSDEQTDPTPEYSLDDLKDLTVTVNGKPLEDFDYKVTNYEINEPGANISMSGLPEGWTTTTSQDEEHHSATITVISPDGSVDFDYTFTYKTDPEKPTYSMDDLKDLTVTVNGQPLEGFNYQTTTYTVSEDVADIQMSGIPEGWDHDVTEVNTETETSRVIHIVSPDGEVDVNYVFKHPITVVDPGEGDDDGDEDKPATPTYSRDDLKNVTVTVNNQSFDGFDYTKDSYTFDEQVTSVQFDHVPAGWDQKTDSRTEGDTTTRVVTLTSPDGKVSVSYEFSFTMQQQGGMEPGGDDQKPDKGGDQPGGGTENPDTDEPDGDTENPDGDTENPNTDTPDANGQDDANGNGDAQTSGDPTDGDDTNTPTLTPGDGGQTGQTPTGQSDGQQQTVDVQLPQTGVNAPTTITVTGILLTIMAGITAFIARAKRNRGRHS